MSNAFRTPIVDSFRNIVRCYLPIRSSPLFSLRAHRSALKSYLEFRHLTQTNKIDQLIAWGGVLTPSIIGKGFWFKRWSRYMQLKIKQFLQEKVPTETLITKGVFISPFELVSKADQSALNTCTDSFRRSAASLYLLFPKMHFEPSEVRGLEFQKRRLECHTPSKWGKYEIRCDGNGRDFASYIRNRETRLKILTQYYTVFGRDYHESLLALLRARKNFANQLGFASWTELHAIANGYESEKFGTQLIDSLFSELNLKHLISRFRKENVMPVDNLDEQFALTQLRIASLPRNETAVAMHKRESVFEYRKILEKILPLIGELFGVVFHPVETNRWIDGWHADVQVFKVSSMNNGNGEEEIGYIYLDLFRRLSSSGSGGGPHCSVLSPQNHVRVFMGFQPPYRSDITFQKERNFTFEEISALMHELGHCLHLLIRPQHSPVAQLPLDMKETVSILCEMYCETDEFVDKILDGNISASERTTLKRNEFFYLDILRNVAVFEYIHSSEFDPHTATVEELKKAAKQVYSKYSPFPLAECFNPLGGEVVNYLMDGDSRVGYLLAYIRASQVLAPVKAGLASGESVFRKVNDEFVRREFEPMMSRLLESHMRASDTAISHPLNPISSANNQSTTNLFTGYDPGALWKFCGLSQATMKGVKEKTASKKPLISKM